ncbi:MAG: phosphodiester glycosidase family protein [Actinomycetota bacterium]
MAPTSSNAVKFIAPVVAVFVSMALLSPGVEAQRRPPSGRIASGVSYRLYRLSKPRNKVRVVTFSPSARATIDTVLANNVLPGRERVRSMANRTNAIVAINGDYSRPSGRPVFTFARDGSLDQGADIDPATGMYKFGRGFALDVDERRAFFDHPKTKAWVWDPKFGEAGSYQVDRVNDDSRKNGSRGRLRAYTRAGGSEESPPRFGCYVRLKASEPPRPTNVTRAPSNSQGVQIASVGVEQRHFVTKSKCGQGPVYPKGGITLYAPKGGVYADDLRSMFSGDEIFYGWSLGWPGVFDTVGGNPTLIERGRVQHQSINDGSSFASGKHPRTAIAYNARNGKLFLVTVDGRQRGYSVGMSLGQLTGFLKRRLGATGALNLDGGGSTTMVVRGRVRGRPSDGSERHVSSALVILPRRDPGEPVGRYSSPPVSRLQPGSTGLELPAPSGEPPAESTYELMVEDPASIGGLSAYLERQDYELPGYLERAAKAFRATK